MAEEPFAFVELPGNRSHEKPRRAGLSMMVDHGLPLGGQRDLLEMAGRYLDFAKIVTGTSRLYTLDYLRAKLEAYRAAEVRPFIGGQFLEYVFATQGRQALRPYFEEAKRVGFATVEVSDNCVPLGDDERRALIGLAIDCGLSVFGEVGSKDAKSDAAELIGQARVCFDAGAELVLVEAAELVEDGRPNRALLDALTGELDMARVMIELPGPWISGVTLSAIEELKKLLIKALGPDVNLANLDPDTLLATEALRVGLGTVGPSERSPGVH